MALITRPHRRSRRQAPPCHPQGRRCEAQLRSHRQRGKYPGNYKISGLTSLQLTTDEITCTPRAVQEHLKKLRKIAQAEGDPTAAGKSTTTPPVKAARKATATPTGVKKTRKPAAAGKGKKGKAAANVDDAGTGALASPLFSG